MFLQLLIILEEKNKSLLVTYFLLSTLLIATIIFLLLFVSKKADFKTQCYKTSQLRAKKAIFKKLNTLYIHKR